MPWLPQAAWKWLTEEMPSWAGERVRSRALWVMVVLIKGRRVK